MTADTLFTCAPGLGTTLSKEPTSKSQNLEIVKKVAQDSANKYGRPFTIFRFSIDKWHPYTVVRPSKEAAAAAKAHKDKLTNAQRERRRKEKENPFHNLTYEQQVAAHRFLCHYILPEMRTLPEDIDLPCWLESRLLHLLTT